MEPIYPSTNNPRGSDWFTMSKLSEQEMNGSVPVIDTAARRALRALCQLSSEELHRMKDKFSEAHFSPIMRS
jgi:hypothetical protein